MMASAIEWTFRMRDGISGPARGAGRSLSDLIQTTHSALAIVDLLARGAARAGQALSVGLAPAVFREKSLGALQTLLGTAEQARDMYAQAVRLAAETPFETRDVVQAFQRLLTARFSQEEVPVALRIIGDAASLQEDSQEAVKSVVRALSQIRSKGRLQGEELLQIQEAVPIDTVRLYERLGKIYEVTADKARRMQEAGQIDAHTATFAILAQLQSQFGGSMARASKQVGGLISTLKSIPFEYLEKLQDTRGYTALREALERIAAGLTPTSERGQRLLDVITRLGSGVLTHTAHLLERAVHGVVSFAEGFETGFGRLSDVLDRTDEEKAKRFADNLWAIGSAAGTVSRLILSLASAIGTVYDWMLRVGQYISERPWLQRAVLGVATPEVIGALTDVGTQGGLVTPRPGTSRTEEPRSDHLSTVRTREQRHTSSDFTGMWARAGLVQGLQDTRGVYEASAAMADASVQGVRDRLGIRSPSRALAVVGEQAAEGYQQGLERGQRGVQSAVRGLTATPRERTGGISVSIPITVTTGVSSREDARGLGEEIASKVETAVLSVLERLQLQSGRLA